MTETHLSTKTLTALELEAANRLAAERLQSFKGFEPGHMLRLSLVRRRLPSIAELAGLIDAELGSVVVEGTLEPEEETFEALRDLFERGAESIGSGGTLVAYAELDGEPEELQAWVMRGEVFAGCFSGEPAKRRREIFAEVIEGFGLEVELTESGGDFELSHTAGGKVRTSGGPGGGKSPESWRAQVMKRSPGELIDAMAKLAGDEADELMWRAQPVFDGRQPLEMKEGRQILDAIMELSPPADAYRIELHLGLRRFADLDALAALCTGGDRISAPFGGFRDSEGRPASIDVWTTSSGHRLALSTKDSKLPDTVAEALGLDFRELPQSEDRG